MVPSGDDDAIVLKSLINFEKSAAKRRIGNARLNGGRHILNI